MSGHGFGYELFQVKEEAHKENIEQPHTPDSKREPWLGESLRLPLVVIFVIIYVLLYFMLIVMVYY